MFDSIDFQIGIRGLRSLERFGTVPESTVSSRGMKALCAGESIQLCVVTSPVLRRDPGLEVEKLNPSFIRHRS